MTQELRSSDDRRGENDAPPVFRALGQLPAEYAAARGTSEDAVRAAVAAGLLPLLADGSIDPTHAPLGLPSMAAYAAHRGVSRQAVAKAAHLLVRHADGTIDAAATDAAWTTQVRTRPTHRQPLPPRTAATADAAPRQASAPAASAPSLPSSQQPADYADARARREAADAALRELRLAETRRSLVPIAAARAVVDAALRRLRMRLSALPDALASQLAAATDEHAVHAMLGAAIDAALSATADDLVALGDAPEDTDQQT